MPFVVTSNPAPQNLLQVISSNLSILCSSLTMPGSIIFSSLYIIPPLQKPTWHTGQGQTLQTSSSPRIRRELSVATEIGAKRVLPLQREPRPSLYFSLPMTKELYDSTSSALLVYMIHCNKCNVQYIGEAKCHLSDSFGKHRRAIEKTHRRFRSLYPPCPFSVWTT